MKLAVNKYTLWAVVFISIYLIINGCQTDHSLNPNKWGRVYMYQALDNPIEVSATIGIDSTTSVVYGAAYGGPERSGGNISVSFSVNSALVDSFNIKHLTSYPILPEKCYTLSKTHATIPASEKATPPLQIMIKGKVKIPEGQYLLPITVAIDGKGKKTNKNIDISKNLETAFFIINVHEFRVVAKDHKYTAVFSDDPANPHYLYFLGIPKDSTETMVWKYDLIGDSLLAEFPKKVNEVFTFPYSQAITNIETGAWLFFSGIHPDPQLYFFANSHYYSYNLASKTAGPLHPIADISTDPWPGNFPKKIECAIYAPLKHASYLFTGDLYEKIHTGPKRAWYYRNAHKGVGGPKNPWPGIPVSFTERGFNGAYYDRATRSIHFFSGGEFVIYNFPTPDRGNGVPDGVQKIKDVYTGL